MICHRQPSPDEVIETLAGAVEELMEILQDQYDGAPDSETRSWGLALLHGERARHLAERYQLGKEQT